MYQKIFITSLVFSLSLVSSAQIFAGGSCQIENGPIPELAQYTRTVDARIDTLIAESRRSGSCGIIRGGASVNVEKTSETIDSAFLEIPIFDNTFLDFLYNIRVAINGDTRAPVLRDGTIFYSIEQRITRAIANVANTCTLDGVVRSGFQSLLQENQTLENIYKQAALGTPTYNYTGLSSINLVVADAINLAYIPTKTESCKDQNGTADPIAKIQKSIESIGAKSESVLVDWQKAIALFQGGGGRMTVSEYNTTQRKLLQTELSRQGYSPRMSSALLGNFDCIKAKSNGSDSAESITQTEKICLINPILGIDAIMLPWRQRVDISTTTDERVYRVNELSREEQIKLSIVKMDSQLKAQKPSAIDIKNSLMLNLIDLHLSLLFTAEAVEKRIPIMYANCMRAQPSVACPRP